MKILLTMIIVSAALIAPNVNGASCQWILTIKNEQTLELQYFDVNVDGGPTNVDLSTHGYTGLCSGTVEASKATDQLAEITEDYERAILVCGISPNGNAITPVIVRGFKYDLLLGPNVKRLAKMTLNNQINIDSGQAENDDSVPLYTAKLKCE